MTPITLHTTSRNIADHIIFRIQNSVKCKATNRSNRKGKRSETYDNTQEFFTEDLSRIWAGRLGRFRKRISSELADKTKAARETPPAGGLGRHHIAKPDGD